jgi:glutathione synthase/RimK-type ligase-like ATP-grasp enzyme
MFHSICAVLQQQCSFWVNPLNADLINNKANQLNIAQQIGFLIPATLISNNPIEIRSFFHSFDRNVIHKSFSPMGWKYKTSIYAGVTNKITLEDLQDDRVLSACPGIYQHYIDKKFEVRITIIGEKCFSVKLDSQSREKTIDYRLSLFTNSFPVEPMSLPEKIQEKLLEFMRKSNLLFGCFDFIVSKENEWIFLEVNPMGQFLWIEELCPELPLLDTFSKLLISSNKKISAFSSNSVTLHLAEFMQQHLIHKSATSVTE